ncbi:enoyl-CoA delta isomerase 1, peroxisomal-like [Mizuhopecten yessoensis]|uniref:enoyl-CoA delta isomerase 1, peroxisomal-like n=1 Tax=Mizuhopecten yessoensis TaxID=6573 RepID=UPI000B458269|nr:enoyl-CoA delta isomerase 1, peroxisomal-like [Mizuhopecten yessoensis]
MSRRRRTLYTSVCLGDHPDYIYKFLTCTRDLIVINSCIHNSVTGHAFGGGAFLAMSHDYRVMRSDRGWISWNETHLKLRLGDMFLNLLSKKVLAMESIREAVLFGKRATANEAKELFLVDAMTELSELIPKAKQMALEALGPNGIDREMLQRMKQDLYVRPSGEKSFLPETNLKGSKL